MKIICEKNLLGFFLVVLSACSPTPGPDKSFTGAVLGAGWGAGAGAIVGNQSGAPGQGAAIGAGIGAVSGLMTGIGLDVAEGAELEQQREIDALKVQVASNSRSLAMLQHSLDERELKLKQYARFEEVYFDTERASLRAGAAAQLERFAETLKLNPYVGHIEIHGHADDLGAIEDNQRLSEARARTVATFLSSHGVSFDRMNIIGHGSELPIATETTEVGRQLNRRVEIAVLK